MIIDDANVPQTLQEIKDMVEELPIHDQMSARFNVAFIDYTLAISTKNEAWNRIWDKAQCGTGFWRLVKEILIKNKL